MTILICYDLKNIGIMKDYNNDMTLTCRPSTRIAPSCFSSFRHRCDFDMSPFNEDSALLLQLIQTPLQRIFLDTEMVSYGDGRLSAFHQKENYGKH